MSRRDERMPVKSSKGGYLRSPFEVSSLFAEFAMKHVTAGSSQCSAALAAEDKDGLARGPTSGRKGSESGGGEAGADGTRPWTRAGVGAGTLNAKERRAQQEQAEKVYGAASTSDAATEQHQQQHMFAVDVREQETMQRIVPRAVRREMKRQSHGGKHPGGGDGDERHQHNGVAAEGTSDDDEAVLSKVARVETPAPAEGSPSTSRMEKENEKATTSASTYSSPRHSTYSSSSQHHKLSSSPPTTTETHKAPHTPPHRAPVTPSAVSAKSMNRMQMLAAQREAALFGKKKKR